MMTMLKTGVFALFAALSALISLSPAAVCQAAQEPASGAPRYALPKWTIMVYINGKNNLEEYAFRNFFQMEQVGSNSNVRVVVQLGRMGTYSTKDGGWSGCRRYLVGHYPSDTNTISSPVVSSTSVCDMGDYNNAIDFFTWAKTNYPADHYMAMLWNHGSGWEKSRARLRGISYDDQTNNHITTPQMASILSALGHIDLYSSDACLMQMAEVGYELKDYVDYIAGSEENEPGEGYQYATFLTAVNASDFSPRAVAKAAVDTYIDQYSAADGVTHSYIVTSALPGLVTRINTLASALMSASEHSVVRAARTSAFNYGSAGDRDISYFASLVSSSTASSAVQTAALDLSSYTANSVVLYNRTKGSDYVNSYGLSIYLPSSYSITGYSELAFAQNSTWPSFLNWLFNTVRVEGTITLNGTPLAGVTVSASGGSSASAVTDSNGVFALSLNKGAAYTLVPTKSGYVFSPASIPVASLSADSSGNSFTSVPGSTAVLLGEASSYPNPFAALKGEKAKIHYTLDTARDVKIRIYNTIGQLVWQQTFPAGTAGGTVGVNEVLWDGRNGDGKTVGRGIYLAALEAGGERVTLKVGVR